MEYKAVCGSNGKTYANICVLKAEACVKKTTITVASEGECSGRIHYHFMQSVAKNQGRFCDTIASVALTDTSVQTD